LPRSRAGILAGYITTHVSYLFRLTTIYGRFITPNGAARLLQDAFPRRSLILPGPCHRIGGKTPTGGQQSPVSDTPS
jgi:hypothetical protein